MTTEEGTASATYEKALTLEADGKIEDAISVLVEMNARQNGPMVIKCFEKACELCLSTDDGAHARRFVNVLSNASMRFRNSQNPDDDVGLAVKTVLKYVRVMFVNAHKMADEAVESPSEEERMLQALSGVPVKKRSNSRFVVKCDKAAATVARSLFGLTVIGLSKRVVRVYNSAVLEFVSICDEFGMTESGLRAVETIAKTLSVAFLEPVNPTARYYDTSMANRKDFFGSEATCTETVDMMCKLLQMMTTHSHWHAAWLVLQRLKQITDEMFNVFGTRTLKTVTYEAMAATFWSCNSVDYHAFCLCTAAIAGQNETLATRAVLAALCCPEVSEIENPFAASAHLVHGDVADLFRHPNTSRKALLAKLQLYGALALANPVAAKLSADVTSTDTAVDFAAAHKSLTALISSTPECAPYDSTLRKVLLNHQLECLATTQNSIDVRTLAVKDSALSDSDYVHVVEPAIIENTVANAEIDSQSKSVSFRNATRVRIVSSFVRLACNVSTRPAVRDMCGPSSSPACTKAPQHIAADDLLKDHQRTRALHAVQKECENSVTDRVRRRDEAVVQERQGKIQERKNFEEQRRDVAKAKHMHKLKTEYMQRERQERYKLVLARLRTKYSGFAVDNAVAAKKPSEFEDELTVVLGNFHRRKAEHDDREALRLNLFQRELRALEIPKRKAYNEKHSEQRRAEQSAARANYLAEHRKEFDRRQQSKNVLRAFLKDADVLQAQWRKLSETEKASKREEQMNRLEAEKERLASGQ